MNKSTGVEIAVVELLLIRRALLLAPFKHEFASILVIITVQECFSSWFLKFKVIRPLKTDKVCHWNDLKPLPALIILNWDFEPRSVSR